MHTFTTEPHPTCKGKVLAITPKPYSWRCLTDTEKAFYAIGGKPWTGVPLGDNSAFTLSPAQARSRRWNSARSEEHTSELQSLMRISYAVFCLKKKTIKHNHNTSTNYNNPHT